MEKNPFTPGNFLIQKNIIQKIDLATTIRYGEDWLLFIHLVLLSDIFCIGGHPIYSYRSHIYQQSKSPISFSERKKVIEAIYNIADLKKKYPIMRYHFLKTKAIIRL